MLISIEYVDSFTIIHIILIMMIILSGLMHITKIYMHVTKTLCQKMTKNDKKLILILLLLYILYIL